ncbi:MAG: CocE/NonD family hydrolase [Oscillospiraceae bacterium]|nr:CocE/NonD family hydrolase [Oscillospiraceae bacterium]
MIRHIWIPLSDGTNLAARIWLPVDAEQNPVPAILEYLPYRKNDLTAFRDEPMHSYFAAHGYASVRVDMRGSGDSDGLLLDEYLPREQHDALEVITWLTAQPWCNGGVGMMGISWGGFNSLQVASRQPPELKAIITVCSTDNRYTDDCHYMGGCVLGSDLLSWASYMFAFNALPPDPAVVGEQWRKTWFERLENTPPFVENWLSHQLLDDYWKQGSVAMDYGAIKCAVYAVGGWADPYTNSIPRLMSGLAAPRKGLIGPWAHMYPHYATPGPAIGFLQECLRWWDYWLKGICNGIMDEPQIRVWLPEGPPPRSFEAEWPGRWAAEEKWPPAEHFQRTYFLTESRLAEEPGSEKSQSFQGSQITGMTAGVWCPNGGSIGMPIDQRADDGLSVCFTSAPLDEPIEILGFPEVLLRVSFDRQNALISSRLCDVAPDGSSRLITWGLVNLTHRKSHESPSPLVPGQVYDVTLQLNVTGYRMREGHCWRIAVSPTYWPHAWPSPVKTIMTLYCGPACRLILPLRRPGELDSGLPDFAAPEESPPLDMEWLRPSESNRSIQYEVETGGMLITDRFDSGRRRISDNGLVFDEITGNTYSIVEGEPLSAKAECSRKIEISRGDWVARVETHSIMTSDESYFYLKNELDAYEGNTQVYTKSRALSILRDHV